MFRGNRSKNARKITSIEQRPNSTNILVTSNDSRIRLYDVDVSTAIIVCSLKYILIYMRCQLLSEECPDLSLSAWRIWGSCDCISISERTRSIIGEKTNELSKLEEPVRFYTGSAFMKLKPRNYVKLQHIFIWF